MILAACDGGSDKKAAKKATPTPADAVALTVGDIRVESGGPPTALPDPIRDAVMTTLRNYVNGAVVTPLRTGTAAADLPTVFTTAAAARVSAPGVDHEALVDDGLPQVTGAITSENAPVKLVGLAEGDGSIVLVSAEIGLVVHGKVKGGTVDVTRRAQLVLANDNGTWKIDGWDVGVQRSAPGITPTTTTASK